MQVEAVHACLAVSGELDLATSADLALEIDLLIEPGRRVAVDLGGVTLMDASAIAACLSAQEHARTVGCELAFTGAQGVVARVLQLLDVEDELRGWMKQ